MQSKEDPYAQAASIIRLPARFLATGRSGMGKTTGTVHLVAHIFRGMYDRLMVICPTYWTQECFRAFDQFILHKNDVITEPTKNTFRNIKTNILQINTKRVREGKLPLHTFIYVDDLSGTKFIQDHRMGDFSHLAIQTPHLNLSMLVITQQATNVSASYRDNTNVVLAYPAQRREETEWLIKEFKNPAFDNATMREVINNAWRGGRADDKEWGEHFLAIYAPSRKKLSYFGDFTREIFVPDDFFSKKYKQNSSTTKKSAKHPTKKRTQLLELEDQPSPKRQRMSNYDLDVD